MTLSPEKVAFIRGSTAKAEKMPPPSKATGNAEKTIELETQAKVEVEEGSRPQRRRRRGRGTSQEGPQVNEILDQLLVPVTIRLQHRTAQALKRVHLEQRLSHAKPDTQQEIVEEAIQDWLGKRGFLD